MNKFGEAAVKAAKEAGKILLKYREKGVTASYKGVSNPVTIADRTSEQEIIRIIRSKFPGHKILSEETNSEYSVCPTQDYLWVIDPLDGTVNYIHGLRAFCVSIGLLYKGLPVLGVIYNPLTKELFYAEKGSGAFQNGKKIAVSKINTLEKSLCVTGFPYSLRGKTKPIVKKFSKFLVKTEGIRRLGSAALDMAYVANGNFEIFWEEGLNPWDVAAGAVIVQEAGGRVSDYDGGNDYIFGRTIAVTNNLVHKPVLNCLAK